MEKSKSPGQKHPCCSYSFIGIVYFKFSLIILNLMLMLHFFSFPLLPSVEFPIMWSNLCSVTLILTSPCLIFVLFIKKCRFLHLGNFISLTVLFFSSQRKSGIHISLPSLPLSANSISLSKPPIPLGQEPFPFPLRILPFNSSKHLLILSVTSEIARVMGKISKFLKSRKIHIQERKRTALQLISIPENKSQLQI